MLDKDKMLMKLASYDKAALLAAKFVLFVKEAKQQKKAGPITETVSSIGYGAIPKLGPAITAVGAGMGNMDTTPTEETEEAWDETPEKALIPGVGAYRLQRRIKKQTVNDKGDAPHFISQQMGTATSLLLAALAGGLIGGGAGFINTTSKGNSLTSDNPFSRSNAQNDVGKGIVAGGMTGAGLGLLANLGAVIGAASTKRRTPEEQKEYANSGTAAEWLVPGVGTYNRWKSIGRSIGDSEDRKKKKKEGEEKTAALNLGRAKELISGVLKARNIAKAPMTEIQQTVAGRNKKLTDILTKVLEGRQALEEPMVNIQRKSMWGLKDAIEGMRSTNHQLSRTAYARLQDLGRTTIDDTFNLAERYKRFAKFKHGKNVQAAKDIGKKVGKGAAAAAGVTATGAGVVEGAKAIKGKKGKK